MLNARQSGQELLRALCVLALLFLNFVHAPASAETRLGPLLTAASDAGFCGDPLDGSSDHAPCHACRIGGGADLPSPPVTPCPSPVVANISYSADGLVAVPGSRWHLGSPRAPPILL